MATVAEPMTTPEFLRLPDRPRVERWLVEGELFEFSMSRRTPGHASAVTSVSSHLFIWAQSRPGPRVKVFAGDVYFRLARDPDTDVGVDVAVATAEQVARLTPDAGLIEGAPLLAVEVVSPSDRVGRVWERAQLYLKHGTPMVWVVDPESKSVTVYRPNQDPELLARSRVLSCETELPGFSVKVSDLFE